MNICVFLVTFLITVFIDLTVAIEVGLGFAAFFFIKKMIDLSEVQNEREVLTGGIRALEQAKAACDRKGITIVISGIHTQPYLLLEKTGMADVLGRENIHDNIAGALERTRALV